LNKLSYRTVQTTKTWIYIGELGQSIQKTRKNHFQNTKKIHLLIDSGLPETLKIKVIKNVESLQLDLEIYYLPAGEDAKTIEAAAQLLREIILNGCTRNDKVLVAGGGAALDAGNFIASVALRGLKSILIPTTLLSMVDASIGGKTALNIDAIKNQIGTFHQPEAVFVDIEFLDTLPEDEIQSGIGEIIKTLLLIGEKRIIKKFFENPLGEEIIFNCIRYKSKIVRADARETRGKREWLNFGHTLGHAIEASNAGKVKHGVAVASGLYYEQLMAECYFVEQGIEIKRFTPLINQMLSSSGLDLIKIKAGELLPYIKFDKKIKEDRQIRWVYLRDYGRPAILKLPEEEFKSLLERVLAGLE